MTWTCKNRPIPGASVCEYENSDANAGCLKCGADRPAGLSDMGMEALEAFNAGRRAIHAVEYEPASFRSAEVTRTEAFAFWKAARAPLEAELTALREITVDARNAMVDALGVGASLMTTAQAIRALNREQIRLEDIVNQQGSDRVGKWEQREAQLATLEAENKTLRERVREFEERYAAASQESIMFRGDANKAAKESEMFRRMHLQICEVAQERAEKIKALEAQLAQAQKPAVKSLADMIAESTTLAMGQQTAALETMIREFIAQTGAKVEDCVLVYQAEREKMTWRIEHRPKGEGGET